LAFNRVASKMKVLAVIDHLLSRQDHAYYQRLFSKLHKHNN
jgi:hypothetical protein